MNIQHSSRTDLWYTPVDIIDKVKKVLGDIDLDPASDVIANRTINAKTIITEKEDALKVQWSSGTIFLNPPGGKIRNKSKTSLFWQRLMKHRSEGNFTHGIFLAFSLEALQNTQGKGCPSIGEFILCIPKKRIAFCDPSGNPGKAPSHSNVIVYVPGSKDERGKFFEAFKDVGTIINLNVTI